MPHCHLDLILFGTISVGSPEVRYTTVDGGVDERVDERGDDREDDGVDDRVRYTTVDEKVTLSALPQGNHTDRSDYYRELKVNESKVSVCTDSSASQAIMRNVKDPNKLTMFGIRVQKYFANLCNKDSLTNLFFEYFLPASQVVAIGHPFIHCTPGAWLSQFPIIGYILIGVIFLVLGLKLKTDEIKDALRSGHVFFIAIISSLFITGTIVAGLTSQIPFDAIGAEEKVSMWGPYEFRIGLLLYYTVPCTITAGIVLVAQAEGNLPMAGAVATVANVIGCYTTPILLKIFLAGVEGEFDIASVLVKLTCSILCPVIAGKLLQFIPGVPKVVKVCKRWISVVTSTCLAIMLWMKVAKAVQDNAFDGVKWQSLLLLIAFVMVMCAINITVNSLFSCLLCMRHPYVRVMLLMVSQKTLVMAVTLVQVLPLSLGEMGLILVPCFVAHPTQILIFSFIAPQLKKRPYDFRCPKFMPRKVIDLCEWLNQNNVQTPDLENSNTVIANVAAEKMDEKVEIGVVSQQPQQRDVELPIDLRARRNSRL